MRLQQIFEAQDSSKLLPFRKNLRDAFHDTVFMYRGFEHRDDRRMKQATFGSTVVYFAEPSVRRSKTGVNTLMYLAKQWKDVPPRDNSVFASFKAKHAEQFGDLALVIPADSVKSYAACPHDFNSTENASVKALKDLISGIQFLIEEISDGTMQGRIDAWDNILKYANYPIFKDNPEWLHDLSEMSQMFHSTAWQHVSALCSNWEDTEDQQEEMFSSILAFVNTFLNAKVVKKYELGTYFLSSEKSKFDTLRKEMAVVAKQPGNTNTLYPKILTLRVPVDAMDLYEIVEAMQTLGLSNISWDAVKAKFTPESIGAKTATSLLGLTDAAHEKYEEVWFSGPYLLIPLDNRDPSDVLLNDILPLV